VTAGPDERRFAGLDFGGTYVKGGALTADGRVLPQDSIPTDQQSGAEELLDQAAELARRVGVQRELGVGVAGLLDREAGVLIESPNMHVLDGVDLVGGLSRRLDIERGRIRLENDANVAALGEQWLGAGRGRSDLLVVTLGTGIGGGLILDGSLWAGPGGNAGEIGHVTVEPEGRACECGSTGCLETLASATAARRRALELGLPRENPGDLAHLSAVAREREGAERELLLDIGRSLGHGLSYAVVLLDLPCFVFAGGFARALDVMEPGIRRGLDERRFGKREVELLGAELGSEAGWRGAAKLVVESDSARRMG
jgi:glucokinase